MSLIMINNLQVKHYLDQVCEPIKAKDVHEDIRLEIISHLEELVEERIEERNITEDEAIEWAIEQMGDPKQIGKQLHAAHKPKVEWGLIALLTVFLAIGLVVVYSAQLALTGQNVPDLLMNKLVYSAIGLVIMVALYYLDYRLLKKYAKYLYGAAIVLLFLAQMQDMHINGQGGWLIIGPISLNAVWIAIYLFILAYAGMLTSEKCSSNHVLRKIVKMGRDLMIYVAIPAMLLFIVGNLLLLAIYAFVLTVLLVVVGRKWGVLAVSILTLVPALMMWIWNKPYYHYALTRIIAFFNRAGATPDSNFHLNRSLDSIRTAGMWGHGIGAKNEKLPDIYREMIFTYSIYSLGWIAGIVIVGLTLLLIGRMLGIVSKLKDPHARAIVIGLLAVIGIQWVWNLGMSVGFMPISSVPLPFIGYSGINTIFEFAAIGFILSVYRRKDMLSSAGPLRL